jgi:hypothetical protein
MSKNNPSRKRAGLVEGNIYGEGGKCIGKSWMPKGEADLRYSMNMQYKKYLACKEVAEVVSAVPRFVRLWRWLKSKLSWQ